MSAARSSGPGERISLPRATYDTGAELFASVLERLYDEAEQRPVVGTDTRNRCVRNGHSLAGPARNARAMNWLVLWNLGRGARRLGDALFQGLEPDLRDKAARAGEALGSEPAIETFTFLSYDQGGMLIGVTGARRLVCVADCGAKVVIFGRESEMSNINAVLEAGLPSVVRCETHPASQTVGHVFGHTHWVWEHSMVEAAPLRHEE